MMELLDKFDDILKLACEWAGKQQGFILENGKPLPPELLFDAKKLGIVNPSKIRLLVVESISRPENPLLEAACIKTNFLTPKTRGLTLYHGIYIRADCINNRYVHIHELVHVTQYERFGGIKQFLQKYLFEIITFGYPSAPLEQEAVNKVKEICGIQVNNNKEGIRY